MRTLIVDDDRETLELLKTFVEHHGHEVVISSNLKEAHDAFRQHRPEFVLLDIRLPDGDGTSLLKTIKAEMPHTVVVMITGFNDAEMIVDAFRQGAMDCLIKPLNLDYLKNRILSRFNK